MDIKGAKPVANRKKQIPFGVNKKTHFSGQTHSDSVFIVQNSQPTNHLNSVAPQQTELVPPAQEAKAFPVPRYEAPGRPKHLVHKHVNKRKVAFRSVALSLVIAATLAGLLMWNGLVKVHKVFHGSSTVAALSVKPVTPSELTGEGAGRVNILLVGTGGPGHTKPDVTNSIMLLSVDPVNNTASLVNIPLDLWVDQPIPYYNKQGKIDTVYESGLYQYQHQDVNDNNQSDAMQAGLGSLDQVVEKLTGETVNYHLLVNFQGFQQAVDAVGGVRVNVPTELKDWSLARSNNGSPILAQAGVQQMSGAQALLYVRSHAASDSYGSLERELQVLIALKDKAISAGTLSNPEKIDALTNAVGNNVYTDLSTDGAERLYAIMQRIGDSTIDSISLTGTSPALLTESQLDGESVLLPATGQDDYGPIQDYVRGKLPDGYLTREDAPITVIGRTAQGASLTGDFLKSYGYNVTVTTMNNQQVSQLVLVDLSSGKDPYTLHYLENRYRVKATKTLPAGITLPSGAAKFVIIEP